MTNRDKWFFFVRNFFLRMTPCLLVITITILLASTFAQSVSPNPSSSKPPASHKEIPGEVSHHELSPNDIESFLDGLVPLQLAREDIAGAVIAVVKDGKVLFAKGYGYSDVAKRTPVSVDATLFRPGSVSKLITWTAVMQQVEQGKLDLDRDVNDYLDFKIPPAYNKPITLRNLMTHTPGFEEMGEEVFVPDVKDLKPIGDFLKHRIPARIFPPGTTPAYSNYGATVGGYIVERVSGQSFNDYVDEHILKPLHMTHSTCREPLPDELKPLMSQGYKVASEPAQPFEVVEALPAGSCSATAADMAKFMIAHLEGGRYEGAQILRPETVELMHTRQFTMRDDMNGMAAEFYEETRNGHRIIGHAGDTLAFHTDLHLMPDAQLGFYVSYNSLGKGEGRPREWVWHRFLDRYFPYTPPSGVSPADAKQDAQTLDGRYLVTRRAETTLLSMFNLIEQTKVYPNSDGTISVDALKDLNGAPKKFREIGPLLFREDGGQDRIAFKRDNSGRMALIIDFPFFIFQKVAWYQSQPFVTTVVGGSAAVLLLALLLWPIGAILRRHYRNPLNLDPSQRRLRLLVRLGCAALLVFVVSLVVFFLMAFEHNSLATPSYNPLLRLLQFIGWIGVVGTIVALYAAVRSWRETNLGTWTRLGNSLLALSCFILVWFAFAHHMFTWNLLY